MTSPQTARFIAQVEDYVDLVSSGETHDEAIRLRLGRISVSTLDRIKRAAKRLQQTAATA
jgi:hypothetical protein